MQRRPPGSISRVAVPVRALLHRFGLVLLLGLSASLMVIGKADPEAVGRLRTAVVDVFAPVLDGLSRPVETANRLVAEVQGMMALRSENAKLTAAVERLRRWERVARRLEQQNAALRALLGLRLEPQPAFVSARVIGDSSSAYVRTVLVNAGAGDGVIAGQAALTGEGLAGRVVEVGRRASRVLLVTDLNSRIPVIVGEGRERAVVAGDNSDTLRLEYLPREFVPAVGAQVMTSGHAGALPPGLPVGVVTSAGEAGVRVRPAADLARLDYVRLVAWQAPRFEPVPEPDEPLPVPAPPAPGEGAAASP
jgi:rod shape-determining protein MreC